MTKQIINGLTYNTETATEICEIGNGLSVTDFAHCTGTLYRTKKGRYFVEGYGGPMSMFACSTGRNSWSGSGGILAFSPEEALNLAEANADAETIEEHFPDLIEDA